MGYGTGKKDTPGVHGLQKAGKMHGGGVKLAHGTKKESDMQEKKNLLNENAIDDTATSMATPKVHSGSFSNGNFMATPRYKSNGTSKAKPDFPDVDGDGNTTESIKSASASITKYGGDKKKVKKVNEIGDRTRKDTYAYRKPEAKVLKN